MRRPYPNSRLALKLRRLRGRFGITAPRVMVRPHIPWYWRLVAVAATGSIMLALAGWIYDAGRRIAGFDRSESAQEIDTLRAKLLDLEAEAGKLRTASSASDSSLQIERTAQQQLAAQVKTLEVENNRLKEENAVFERLAKGGGKENVITINRLRVLPEGSSGRYRFQFMVAQTGDQRGQEFKGNVQLAVTLKAEGDAGMMTYPRPNDPDAGRFEVSFKHFRSIDGAFTLPSGAKPKSVEVRLLQEGVLRASQSVTL